MQSIASNNIVSLRQKIEKQKRREQTTIVSSEDRRFNNLEPRINSGVQTFFRTNYRTHINLSAIADQKANIMISVNRYFNQRNYFCYFLSEYDGNKPGGFNACAYFFSDGLASLIFAVLAARPKVTSIINDGTPIEDAKKHLVFFWEFCEPEY